MKYLLNAVQLVQYFALKYLKRTVEKNMNEIGFIKHVAGMKYLLGTVQ